MSNYINLVNLPVACRQGLKLLMMSMTEKCWNGMEYKRQILVSWKRMVSALLENVADRIVMEHKRIVVSAWAWKKERKTYRPANMGIPVACIEDFPPPQSRVYQTLLSQLFPNISALREYPPNVFLFSLSFYFSLAIKFVYNKFRRMYGNRKYQLEMEIAWFTIRFVLLHRL